MEKRQTKLASRACPVDRAVEREGECGNASLGAKIAPPSRFEKVGLRQLGINSVP